MCSTQLVTSFLSELSVTDFRDTNRGHHRQTDRQTDRQHATRFGDGFSPSIKDILTDLVCGLYKVGLFQRGFSTYRAKYQTMHPNGCFMKIVAFLQATRKTCKVA